MAAQVLMPRLKHASCARRTAALLLAAGLLAGCGRTASPPDPTATAEEATEALASAGNEVAQTARSAARSVQAGQVIEAWAGFASLAEHPALTDEQRAAAQRAVIALLPSLNRAAESGDARARALIENYRRTK